MIATRTRFKSFHWLARVWISCKRFPIRILVTFPNVWPNKLSQTPTTQGVTVPNSYLQRHFIPAPMTSVLWPLHTFLSHLILEGCTLRHSFLRLPFSLLPKSRLCLSGWYQFWSLWSFALEILSNGRLIIPLLFCNFNWFSYQNFSILATQIAVHFHPF